MGDRGGVVVRRVVGCGAPIDRHEREDLVCRRPGRGTLEPAADQGVETREIARQVGLSEAEAPLGRPLPPASEEAIAIAQRVGVEHVGLHHRPQLEPPGARHEAIDAELARERASLPERQRDVELHRRPGVLGKGPGAHEVARMAGYRVGADLGQREPGAGGDRQRQVARQEVGARRAGVDVGVDAGGREHECAELGRDAPHVPEGELQFAAHHEVDHPVGLVVEIGARRPAPVDERPNLTRERRDVERPAPPNALPGRIAADRVSPDLARFADAIAVPFELLHFVIA